MTDEQLERAIELFNAALELSTAARDSYLRLACEDQAGLRSEVERLLRRHEQAGDFLESPVLPDSASQAFKLAGRQIGQYKLLRELGEGGMGIVYLATRTDDAFRKEVAVKLVWPHLHLTGVVRRFEQERHILAALDHPNIARLLDGGTTADEGWPYVVMEYVDGQAITDYCDARNLSISERLKLFIGVCSAVEYAHQNLIVHRDLKPSNILVTGNGIVKLLDFGIAKVLAPEQHGDAPLTTRTGLRLMTPEYASPEQVSHRAITTASDIYSLGLLLYELLTGARPHELQRRPLHEVIRVICEEEPDRPSVKVLRSPLTQTQVCGIAPEKLRRQLQGDLDNIVLKALQKDARLRYQTVEQLSKDLQHHLTGQPVTARPATWHYRTEKYVRRNKALVVLAAALLLTLIVGASVALWQLRASRLREREQRQQLYAADMRQAGQDWADGNLVRMNDLLERHGPGTGSDEWRGSEWLILWKLLHTEKLTLPDQTGVPATRFTPDGKHILTTARDGRIEMWDAETGRHLETVGSDQPEGVFTLLLTADGRRLITNSFRGHVRIRDFHSRLVIAEAHSPAGHRAWPTLSSDGKQLAVYWSPQLFKLFDTETGQLIQDISLPADRTFERSDAAVFAPDGRLLCLSRMQHHWELWDVFARRVIARLDPQSDDPNAMNTSYSLGMVLSHNGQRLYLPTLDYKLRSWDLNSGKLLHVFSGHQDLIEKPALSADDRLLVSGSNDSTLRFWDTQTGRQLAVVKNESAIFYPVFSADDKYLAAVCARALRTKVWDVQKLLAERPQVFKSMQTLAVSPDGKTMLVVSEQGLDPRLMDLQTGQILVAYPYPFHRDTLMNNAAFSPDGKLVMFGEYVCETQSGKLVVQLPEYQAAYAGSAFSPDGRLTASSSSDKVIKLREPGTWRELMTLTGVTEEAMGINFSPDGRYLAAGDWGNTVHIWDVTNGQAQTLRGHRGPVHEVCFSPDGKMLASASVDFTIKLWDVATGRELRTLHGHGNSVNAVAFSPDGRRLVSGGDDQAVRLWDTQTGAELTAFRGHTGNIWQVFFTPDGKTVISASANETRVWRAASDQDVLARTRQ